MTTSEENEMREIDWVQLDGQWVVMDCDTGEIFGRFVNEIDALRVVDEYRWSGCLPLAV